MLLLPTKTLLAWPSFIERKACLTITLKWLSVLSARLLYNQAARPVLLAQESPGHQDIPGQSIKLHSPALKLWDIELGKNILILFEYLCIHLKAKMPQQRHPLFILHFKYLM